MVNLIDNNLLLVEGPDDAHVFHHLSRHYQIHDKFSIKPKQGIDNLLDTLDVELLVTNLERIGIVVDADLDLKSRWQALQTILSHSGYTNIPSAPIATGTIIEQDNQPTVGIWLMPDNSVPGTLENFISFLIPTDDTLWDKAADCIQRIPQKERLFPSQYQNIKAHLHTWLAWQKEPGKPMGQAITKRFLDPAAPHAQTLIAWLRRLFDV